MRSTFKVNITIHMIVIDIAMLLHGLKNFLASPQEVRTDSIATLTISLVLIVCDEGG